MPGAAAQPAQELVRGMQFHRLPERFAIQIHEHKIGFAGLPADVAIDPIPLIQIHQARSHRHHATLSLNPWMIGGNDRRVNSENAS